MKRPLLYYISPYILAAIFCVIEVIVGLSTGREWGFLYLIIFGSALINSSVS